MDDSARRGGQLGVVAPPAPMMPMHWIDTTPVESTDVPCVIEKLDVQVRVCGLYADIVETMAIRNPNARDMSVSLAIQLPDRAVVCGYALDIEDQMIDGVVVPKEKARVAFENEQRIGADPGLVESVKGNVYRTRIYPVRRHGLRTVKLSYVAPLLVVEGKAAFLDVPMPTEHMQERVVHIDVELLDCPAPELSGVNGVQFEQLGTCWSVESQEDDVAAGACLRVALPKLPQSFSLIERDEEGSLWFCASEVALPAGEGEAPEVTSLVVLWDTSGSRATVDHAVEVELLRSYCAGDDFGPIRFVSFSDHVESALAFDTADELIDHINTLDYDGGSDFEALSRALAAMPEACDDAPYVLFTDGMDTLSGEPLSFPDGCKVMSVLSGAQRDMESLRQACCGFVFDIAAAPKDAMALARALYCSNLLSGIDGEGIAEVMGVGSGGDGRYTVLGRMDAPTAFISLANTHTRYNFDDNSAREGSVLAHAWAAQRVAQLAPRADENVDELLKLGRRFGVVSPATSLLVLETLDQWLRYDIEPPVTWENMHSDWERSHQGMMRLFGELGSKNYHVENLKHAWADLRTWWERNYVSNQQDGSDGRVFCTRCGELAQAGDRFCRSCGCVLRQNQASEGGNASVPPSPTGAYRTERLLRSIDFVPSEEYALPDCACSDMEYVAPISVMADCAIEGVADEAASCETEDSPVSVSINVQAWMPDAEYLTALDEALPAGLQAVQKAYFEMRAAHAASPSFFTDCAGWFLAHDEVAFGLRVLTNLAELRIEDAALLRVMAWRLREAGELSRALGVLRRVLKLRPEDSQSHRDIALVLDEMARERFAEGDEAAARQLAEEAGVFYRKIALTPWERRAESIGLFAVEEYNVMRAWAESQVWEVAPQLESLGEELEGVLDCDLRITLAWDADETDVDIHVTEPTGEEAYYAHRLTSIGGRVSEDITDGYGPELYEIRRAWNGAYIIRAHYFASHQQSMFGPASCTLTVYTDWGRPTQKKQISSTRLENEREMVFVGTAVYGDAAMNDAHSDEPAATEAASITKGSSVTELIATYGVPDRGDPDCADAILEWALPGGRNRLAMIANGKVQWITEKMPGGEVLFVVR